MEPAIATKTGSGQYLGCPEINTEFSDRVNPVIVMLRLNRQHTSRWKVCEGILLLQSLSE